MKRKLLIFALLLFQFSFCNVNFLFVYDNYKDITLNNPEIPNLNPLTVCDDNNDGFAVFDLTFQTPSILVAQSGSSSNYTVTYHESFTDASLGSSPLNASSYYNFNPNSQTIYYRIVDITTSEYSVGSFVIVVNNRPYFNNPSNLSICDTDSNPYNGSTFINLDVQTPLVLAQQPLSASNYSVTYYTSMSNAEAGTAPILNSSAFLATNEQTIWVRCESIYTGCYYVGSFSVVINIPLQVTTPTPLNKCDNDSFPNDQYSNFDLTVKIPDILQGAVGCVVNFYPSFANALANTNQISTPTNYVNIAPAVQTLGVKVTTSSGCISYTTLNIRVLPIPFIDNNLPDFMSCDTDGINDGMMVYQNNTNGLGGYVNSILGATQMSLGYTVHFYTNLTDAQNNTFANAIPNLSTYQVQTGTYYVTVSNPDPDGCFAIDSFNVTVQQLPEPNITTNTGGNTACVDWNNTVVNNNLILNSNISNTGHTFSWYKNAMLISGANSSTLAITNINENSTEYSVRATSTSLLGCQSDISNFTVIRSGTASPTNGSGYVVTNLSGVQSISVIVAGFGIYQFQLDNNTPQNIGYFENVSLGTHTINVIDYGGCGVLTLTVEIIESLVPAPDGLNSQSFTEGQTLADIVVNGENIQWYSSANGTTPLPFNTPLVNGVTYYATQTLNGIESAARLAVTVTVSLGIPENQLLNVLLSPNPVKHSFQLQSRDILKSVELYNLLGQKVLEQHSNTNRLSVDISHLHSGNYILKVYSDNGQKTLRLIKE